MSKDIRLHFDQDFFDQGLLSSSYVKWLRDEYLDTRGTGFANPFRSYKCLLELLTRIHSYNQQHALSFVKRLKAQGKDCRNGHAVFSEIIIYATYVPLVAEGVLKRLNIQHDDCDLCIERCDGSKHYLECFCVMPNRSPDDSGIVHIKTHLQEEFASIRQKVLHKVRAQRQMIQSRENWLVIELNDAAIAGDFAVLSSLSDGYKIPIDAKTGKWFKGGYDWSSSFFDDEEAKRIRGIMWFDLGAYNYRRTLLNPNYTN